MAELHRGEVHAQIIIRVAIDCGTFNEAVGISDELLLFDYLPRFNVISRGSGGMDYVYGASLEEKIRNLLDPSGHEHITVEIFVERTPAPPCESHKG